MDEDKTFYVFVEYGGYEEMTVNAKNEYEAIEEVQSDVSWDHDCEMADVDVIDIEEYE